MISTHFVWPPSQLTDLGIASRPLVHFLSKLKFLNLGNKLSSLSHYKNLSNFTSQMVFLPKPNSLFSSSAPRIFPSRFWIWNQAYLKKKDFFLNICSANKKYIIPERAFNPQKILLRSRGSRGLFSSFIYTLMHYFSYEIGLFFAFFHVKCTDTYWSFSKYIEVLDLVRVGQYWQKPLWYMSLCGWKYFMLWLVPVRDAPTNQISWLFPIWSLLSSGIFIFHFFWNFYKKVTVKFFLP